MKFTALNFKFFPALRRVPTQNLKLRTAFSVASTNLNRDYSGPSQGTSPSFPESGAGGYHDLNSNTQDSKYPSPPAGAGH
jgi:hypothetical protein